MEVIDLKKKIFLIIFLILITGCSSNVNNDLNSLLTSKGKCSAFECINNIEPTNTVEEINNIIGIIGQLTDEKYNKYYWELSDDSGIEVTYYSGDTGTISVDFDNEVLKNEKVDFSKYDEIKSQLDSGQSLTYDEFVTKVGGVQGILIEKSEYNKVFIWVANDDSYLKATFSESTGKCTFIVGFVY